ncbi:M28 family peptidase, partial [bacterium]
TLEVSKLPNKVSFSAQIDSESVGVPNVVGLLEGSDPTLKEQIVGIGAHLDHMGKSGDTIFYGADDDGSGSAALLLTARALTTSSVKPKRSILFMAFCGEEMGLIGSGHYADNPIYPHSQMVAELQMDMVGRDSDGEQNGDSSRIDKASENTDTMRLVGSKRISTELDAMILRLNQHTGFKFKYDSEDVYTRSDHYNFAKNGIPIAFFFDGFHPDYHQPTDTVEKINFLKLTTTARLVYLTATELATRPAAPVKDVKQTKAE